MHPAIKPTFYISYIELNPSYRTGFYACCLLIQAFKSVFNGSDQLVCWINSSTVIFPRIAYCDYK